MCTERGIFILADTPDKFTKRMAPGLTDMGNGIRLVKQYGNKIRYCYDWGKWLIWDEKRWTMDKNGAIMRTAKDTVRSIYIEAAAATEENERKTIAKHAIQSESESKLKAMIALAESEIGIPVKPELFDQNKYLLNCSNGTIELKTGIIREHRQEDFITKMVPTAYDTKATCPTWLAFLERIFESNKVLIKYIQKSLGYCLTGDTKEQVIFILHGTGANGKSTLLEAVAATLGDDYAQQTPTSTLMVKRNDANSNDIARLRGARFVSAVEAEEGQRLAESLVKQMTGGDRLTARFLYSEHFEFRPEFKLFLGTNHKPQIRGTDYAIWRRIRLIPFNVTIPEDEQDKNLPGKLRAETPGILKWMLEGCLVWQKEGLGMPDEVKSATEGYRMEMDKLADFLDERCITAPHAKVKISDLYKTYLDWCEENGEKASNKRIFGEKIRERGFTNSRSGHGGTWWWEGIGLVNNKNDDENGDLTSDQT